MAKVLSGKLAIVTGASRGIGAAIAENLASKGANLVINYTSPSSADPTSQLVSKWSAEHGVKAVAVQADLGAPDGARKLLDAAAANFSSGGGDGDATLRIDIIVNNAGVARNALLPDVTVDDFHATYAVNVLGPILLVQAAARHLPRDRSGRVVNVSSVSSSTGFVTQTVYGGTKAALEAMTRTWARELAEQATVNAVNPGPVLGPMYSGNLDVFKKGIQGWIDHTPLMAPRPDLDSPEQMAAVNDYGGRPTLNEEVARVVGLLCSPDAALITGQVICANGGMIFK